MRNRHSNKLSMATYSQNFRLQFPIFVDVRRGSPRAASNGSCMNDGAIDLPPPPTSGGIRTSIFTDVRTDWYLTYW